MVTDTRGGTHEVLVDLEPDMTAGALCEALGRSLRTEPPAEGDLWVDGRCVGASVLVGDAALYDGARVALLRPDPLPPAAAGAWQLLVVGGPCSGTAFGLRPGDFVLGRTADLRLDDEALSRRHLRLRVQDSAVTVEDLGSANGTVVDGKALTGAVQLLPGQLLEVGDSLLTLTLGRAADAAVEPPDEGGMAYNRPPRLLPPGREVKVRLPREPQGEHRRSFPLVAVLAPAAMGLVMATVLHNPLYLLFAAMSPVMSLANTVAERRAGRTSQRRQQEQYQKDLSEARSRLEEARLAERTLRRAEHPDPASTRLTAVLPDRRLWERRLHDDDALELRVGLAHLPARVRVTTADDGGQDDLQVQVEHVPVTVALREAGVVGVAGPRERVRATGRWVVTQLAVRHTPRDLSLVVLTDPAAARDWDWLRWLPHARPTDGTGPTALVGNDRETVAARVTELAGAVRRRLEAAGSGAPDPSAYSAVVVVLDGARALRAVPGMAQVLQDGPRVGVLAVCLDERERLLPQECQAVVAYDGQDPALVTVSRSRGEAVRDVLADQVSAGWAREVARALSPLRDVTGEQDEAQLPASSRLLEVLGLEDPTGEAVAARWTLSGQSTTAVVGVGADGPFALDLRRDGPHGLLAGTTGSGKSELLQTVVASLAVANRPDAMTFVLVDYKGGSAFKDCARLPHTVGMVTDLDTTLVERALTSLKAELQRREHQLAAARAKDIEDYVELARRAPWPALPRLLIVIDEFASLARELPDFVTGLVNIAQRGRSLGIHLLLATQRPSGVVSPEIRANTNLRIALRVTDEADSTDVIGTADAARTPKSAPGRAYARLGHTSLVAFQAGRVGGRRPGTAAVAVRPPHVVPLEWGRLGYAAPEPPRVDVPDDVEVTDLSTLVHAVGAAAERLQVPPQHSPWLPALPVALTLDDLPPTAPTAGDLEPVPYGLEDLPAEQDQRAAALDLAVAGHLFAVGAPRVGRSQLLRTIAASAARRHSVADVHVYALDCGNGALLPLAELPHTGAVVQRTQPERAARLLARLKSELERRQAVLGDGGFADVTEQRRASAPQERLPHVLLLLDRWEGFMSTLGELDNGRLHDEVLALLREGASTGIHLVVTGDRSLLSGRVSSLTEDKLAFRMADRGDFALLGLNAKKLPEDIAPGRAYRSESGTETQVALLTPDPSGVGQAAAVGAVAKEATERDATVHPSLRPSRVDVLPSRLTFAQAWDLRDGRTGPLFGLVGVGGDELRALGPDLGRTPAFVVAGPGKSGRSTLLVSMARSFLTGGARVVVVAPRPSPLRELAGTDGVLGVLMDASLPEADLEALLGQAGGHPVGIVLDDAELLKDCGASDLLRTLVKGTSGSGRAVVLGGSADDLCSGFSGWQVEAKKARQGALLSPQGLSDGDLIGVRVPRTSLGERVQPGRALLHLGDGRAVAVQVPLLD